MPVTYSPDMEALMPAPTMAAANGEVVTQRHANYCTEHGHASWTVDGIDNGRCARCGEVTTATRQINVWVKGDADTVVATVDIDDDYHSPVSATLRKVEDSLFASHGVCVYPEFTGHSDNRGRLRVIAGDDSDPVWGYFEVSYPYV